MPPGMGRRQWGSKPLVEHRNASRTIEAGGRPMMVNLVG